MPALCGFALYGLSGIVAAMNWCCLTFKSRYEVAGERSFAVLIERGPDGPPQFILQHRAIDRGSETSVHSEEPVALVSEVRIHYCPWCGRDLKRAYGKYADALSRRALRILIPGVDD